MKPTALFIGRFQPYHMGHHMVIKGMTRLAGRIVIGIGSSENHHETDNPFTAQERKEMIQQALQDDDVIPMFDINFVELPDKATDEEWTDHVLETVGNVDVLWTGNEDTAKCLEGKLDIQNIKEVPGISATSIRDKIKAGDTTWKEQVPAAVVKGIQDLGTDRIS